MNKKLFTVLLLLVFAAPMANASFMSGYQKFKSSITRGTNKAVTTTNQALSKADATVNSAVNAKATERKNIEAQKKAALTAIKNDIKAKKSQISEVKKSTVMLESEKELRIKAINKEIELLNKKYDTTEKVYNKRLEALK